MHVLVKGNFTAMDKACCMKERCVVRLGYFIWRTISTKRRDDEEESITEAVLLGDHVKFEQIGMKCDGSLPSTPYLPTL